MTGSYRTTWINWWRVVSAPALQLIGHRFDPQSYQFSKLTLSVSVVFFLSLYVSLELTVRIRTSSPLKKQVSVEDE